MKKGYAAVRFMKGSSCNQFEDKEYYFVTHLDLEEDDIVVVDTRYGMALGIVSQLLITCPLMSSKDNPIIMREVICKVDTVEFQKRKEIGAEMAKLRKMMDARIDEIKEEALYETFAKADPTLKELLEKYKGLDL